MTSHEHKGIPTGGQFAKVHRSAGTCILHMPAERKGAAETAATSEFELGGHDAATALQLAITRVRHRNDAVAHRRWSEDRYEDESRIDALRYMSCAPQSAYENAVEGGSDPNDPDVLAAHIDGALMDSPLYGEVQNEADRIRGAPPKQRALTSAEENLAHLEDMVLEARTAAAEASSHTDNHTDGDRAYFQREIDRAVVRARYAADDVEALRELDSASPQAYE